MLILFVTSDFESSVSDAVSLSVNLLRPLRRCDADDFVRAGEAVRAGDRFLDERLDDQKVYALEQKNARASNELVSITWTVICLMPVLFGYFPQPSLHSFYDDPFLRKSFARTPKL